MRLSRTWQRKLFRLVPRRRHLRGGRLHRFLGEGFFRPQLWALTTPELAKGFALGLFIGCTPTMGVQFVLAGVTAFFLRVNVPIALLATLISNPLTAPFLYPLEYKLGLWLVGTPTEASLAGFPSALASFVYYARPLWAGSLLTAAVCSALGYGAVFLLTHILPLLKRRRRDSLPTDRPG